MRRVYIIFPGRSCVDPASSLPLATGGGFTQLRSGNKYIYAICTAKKLVAFRREDLGYCGHSQSNQEPPYCFF